MAINYVEEEEIEHPCPGCGRPLISIHYDQEECAYVCPDCDTLFDPEHPDYYKDEDDDEEL